MTSSLPTIGSLAGMEALRTLQNAGSDIPFILVTGTLGDERAVECVKQGAADYIIKGNLERLPTAVRRALHDKRLRDEQARNEDLIRKLRLAVDHCPASVLITDASGTIEYATRLEQTPRAREVKGGTETVLVVEDAPIVRSLVLEILARYGYTALEATGSIQALEIASRHNGPIDLLLTDVVMPALGGRELAERLAHLRPEMRVLYMSGYADDAVMRHGVLTAGTAYVQKPFTPAGLALKVRDVLDAELAAREREP